MSPTIIRTARRHTGLMLTVTTYDTAGDLAALQVYRVSDSGHTLLERSDAYIGERSALRAFDWLVSRSDSDWISAAVPLSVLGRSATRRPVSGGRPSIDNPPHD